MNDKVKNIAEKAVAENLYEEIEKYLLENFRIFTNVQNLKDHISYFLFRDGLIKILKSYIEL